MHRLSQLSGLSSVISAQFTLEMRVAVQNREKFTKTPYFGGFNWSFKVINVNTSGKLVSSACYDAASLCLSATVLMLDELIAVK